MQWTAYDLLWQRSDETAKQELLKYSPLHSEVGIDYTRLRWLPKSGKRQTGKQSASCLRFLVERRKVCWIDSRSKNFPAKICLPLISYGGDTPKNALALACKSASGRVLAQIKTSIGGRKGLGDRGGISGVMNFKFWGFDVSAQPNVLSYSPLEMGEMGRVEGCAIFFYPLNPLNSMGIYPFFKF